MHILPVLDIRHGAAVAAVRGQRHAYRPLVSCLTRSVEPAQVLYDMKQALGSSAFYVADIDAIEGRPPSWPSWLGARHENQVWLDAGVRDSAEIGPLLDGGAAKVILALESLVRPAEVLPGLVEKWGADRLVFSIDLYRGVPVFSADPGSWAHQEALSIAKAIVRSGIQTLIVLDLDLVGSSAGPGRESLCRQIKQALPAIDLVTGGGVRSVKDLRWMQKWGAAAALVATALHDGRLTSRDLLALS